MNENQNAGGATREAGASTQSECRAVCLSKPYSQCAAYDFNQQNNECWIHSTKPTELIPATGILHYSRVQCSSGGNLFK